MSNAVFNPPATDLLDISDIEEDLIAERHADDSGLAGVRWLGRALALMLLSTVAFWPVTNLGFLWHDAARISEDRTLKSTLGLKLIWTQPFHARSLDLPLGQSLFWAEYKVFRTENAQGYHAVGMSIHAANAVLLLLILSRLSFPTPHLIAGVWAIHPALLPGVAITSYHPVLLASTFCLLATLAFCGMTSVRRFDLDDSSGRVGRVWRRFSPGSLFVMSACLASITHPIAWTLPAVLILLAWCKGMVTGRASYALLVAVGLINGLVLAAWVAWHSASEPHSSLLARLILWPASSFFIATHAFVPGSVHLLETHDWTNSKLIFAAYPALGVVFALLLLARSRIGRSAALFVAIVMLLALPQALLADVTPAEAVFAPALAYLATAVVVVAVCTAASRLLIAFYHPVQSHPPLSEYSRFARPMLIAVLLLAGLACGFGSFSGATTLKSESAVWEYASAAKPTSTRLGLERASALARAGEPQRAAEAMRRVLANEPGQVDAAVALAESLAAEKRFDEALALLEHSRFANENDARLFSSAANIHAASGDRPKALEMARRAVALNTFNDPAFHHQYGLHLQSAGDSAHALEEYAAAIAIDTTYIPSRINRATLFFQQGNAKDAADELQTVLRHDPRNFEAFVNAGTMLAAMKEWDKAERMYRSAAVLRPGSSDVWTALSVALAEQGKMTEAGWSLRQGHRLAEAGI